jgi:anti-anti-sigma factor
MESGDLTLAVRPGEHACSRIDYAQDGDRTAAAYILDGLMLGHKVVYMCDRDASYFESQLTLRDHRFQRALARGQLEIRPARDSYLPDGRFDLDRTIEMVSREKARALDDGYPALRMSGEMTWALEGTPGTENLAEYERRLVDLFVDETLTGFCQYDERRFGSDDLSGMAAAHDVDISPELAPLGRSGYLSAARVGSRGKLRLTGALDAVDADRLAALLDEHFDRRLDLDLGDVSFIDVAGIRALATGGRNVRITRASRPVRRLFDVLGWDTVPGVELAEEQ